MGNSLTIKIISAIGVTALILATALWLRYGTFQDKVSSAPPSMSSTHTALSDTDLDSPQTLKTPDESQIPSGPMGESILRGKHILENTYEMLPKYVGAKMNCTSCHLTSGTKEYAGPWVGITTRFPQYRARSGKVDTLNDRVNDCFERSLNGKRLPENSEAMTDIVAYMTWLSKGYRVGGQITGSGMPRLNLKSAPDIAAGKTTYETKCASCHQTNGAGVVGGDGKVAIPALWGDTSFNIGAGMARLQTAAGFVKHNMPLGQGGTLTDEEAQNVAAYFTTKPRPDFRRKAQDWPKGEKPSDARY